MTVDAFPSPVPTNQERHVRSVHITESLFNGTKVKTLALPVPAGGLVENVLGELLAYSTAATSSVFRIGDDDDAQGYLADQDMTSVGAITLSVPTAPTVSGWAVVPGNSSNGVFATTNNPTFSSSLGKHYPNGGRILFSLTTVDDGTHATLDAWVWVLYTMPAVLALQ